MALLTFPWPQLLDANGDTYPGAKLYFYETGTSTLASVYTDAALTTPHTNPVVADANGVFEPIYLASKKYKAILKTAADVTLFSADPVTGEGFGYVSDYAALRAVSSPTDGQQAYVTGSGISGLFVFDSSESGADNGGTIIEPTDATTGAWVRQHSGDINILWFGAEDGTDSTTAIQAAIDHAISAGGEIVVPPGNYTVSSTLLADHTKIADKDGVSFRGLGSYRDCKFTYTGTGYCIDASGTGDEAGTLSTRWSMENLSIFGNQNATATGALNISRSFLITIKDCEFGSFYSTDAAVLDVTNCFNVDFQNCHIYCGEGRASLNTAKGVGVRLGADDTSWSTSNVRFQNCLIQFCDEGVVIVATGAGANVDSVVFDCTGFGSNREYAVYSGADTGGKTTIRFTNCHIETTGLTDASITAKTALHLDGWSSAQIDSCHFNSNNVDIDIIDCNSTFITNCRFFETAGFDAVLAAGTAVRADNSGSTGAKVVIGPCSIDTADKETRFDISNTYYYFNESAEFGDAYDGRTFTPTLLPGDTGTITTDVAQGWYCQVGPMVYFTARLETASVSSPTGILYVSGLPLTCEETNRWAVSFEGDGFDLNGADLAVVAYVNPDSDDVILSGLRDGAASANLAPTVVAGTDFTVSGCYRSKPLA
jgi:hypothetical protein